MAAGACSRRAPQRPVDRIAVLPFENLTGDDSLDWIAPASSTIVASEMSGTGKIVPFRANDTSDGYLAAADRFVHGYFTGKAGSLDFQVEVEDAATHKITAYIAGSGPLLQAMNVVAKRIDPAARAFSTSNEAAAEAWGRGDFERAVTLDPQFGEAWIAWIESLSRKGETEDAAGVADRALARSGLRSDVNRARIQVLAATLHKDPSAREQALSALARLLPTDTSLAANLAEVEMNAHNFEAAAAEYRKILTLDPNNSALLNSLGYAEGFAGDLDAARKAFEEYGKQPGQSINALDSMGEVLFANGRFSEAEKYFLDVNRADPGFLGGVDLLKAAYARWLGGDLKNADTIMAHYLEYRRKQHDPSTAWRDAMWDYTTGRRDLAIEKLQAAPPAQRPMVERQLALWTGKVQVRNDLATLKQKYEQTPPSNDGQVRVFYAEALMAAGQKEEARKLLKLWPLPEEAGEPLLQSLVYPKFIALRKEAGL